MSAPMKTGIPPDLDLNANYVIQFTALDASTGAAVTSVSVSNASLLVANVGGAPVVGPPEPGEIEWLNLPVEGE